MNSAIHAINDPSIEGTTQLSSLLKAASDPLRVTVLQVLNQDSYGVLELCQILDHKQSGLSHHLKILAKAGLVNTRREGNTIFYRRSDSALNPELDELQQSLLKSIDALSLSAEISERIERVRNERAESSRQFFADNADKFRSQQELIASYELYGPATAELIERNVEKPKTALEIGPGEGQFLAELSPRFEQVVALDNSQAMLDLAKQLADQKRLENIRFIHGDTQSQGLSEVGADCAVINMVLHHVPSPAEMVKDVAGLVIAGGQLYVADLCPHDQTWTKEACGDLWLGFEPEELTRWADAAGFDEGESIYLAQRNGFRVQIREFVKRAVSN